MARGKKTGGGSRAGVPNKATANAREAIAAFVDANTPLLNELLVEIRAEDGPRAAFECIRDLLEYHVPKLQRSEVKTEGSLDLSGTVLFINAPGGK